MSRYTTIRGFTIVELLVVIVIIAVLATVSVLIYRGLSDRALSTRFVALVNTYDKTFRLVKAELNTYKSTGGPGGQIVACLGEMADYPATSEFPAGACVANATTHAAVISVDTALNNDVLTRISSIPHPPQIKGTLYGGDLYRGPYVTVENTSFEIELALPEAVPCPSNMRQYTFSGIHWCERGPSD